MVQAKESVYTDNSVRSYLREIGKVPLLKPEEEIALSKDVIELGKLEKIRRSLQGRLQREPNQQEWADEVAKTRNQSFTLQQLKSRLFHGKRAKEKMIQSNLRLVVAVAKKYVNRGVPLQDLIQEGSLGLIRAVEKFDPAKGYRFSTYAIHWIRQAVSRSIAEKARTIRIPVNVYEKLCVLKQTKRELERLLGRTPTEDELATRMEITIEKLRFIQNCSRNPVSLDVPITKEEDGNLMELIEDESAPDPEQETDQLLARQKVLEFVESSLDEDEKTIVKFIYGLGSPRLLPAQMSEELGLSVTRIKAIEIRAMRKLKAKASEELLLCLG